MDYSATPSHPKAELLLHGCHLARENSVHADHNRPNRQFPSTDIADMSSPAIGSPINGHVINDEDLASTELPERQRNGSDAQNGVDDSVRPASPPPMSDTIEDAPNHADDDNMVDEDAYSEEDASHDADYEMHESPQSHHNDPDEILADRASSTDSNRASKRKAPVEEDDFIRANPELYGLRRSVRLQPMCDTAAFDHADVSIIASPPRTTKDCRHRQTMLP